MIMCVLDFVPFLYQRKGEVNYKMDVKAIVQALIISAVTGMTVMYGTERSLQVELSSIKANIADMKQDISSIKKDFYVPRP